MESLNFTKMHGLGNDFVLVDCREQPALAEERLQALSQAVCERHFGVGADGLILILPDDEAACRMRMFNPDGSEAEMCGNGIRCFGKYLFDSGAVASGQTLSVATLAGLQQIEIAGSAARGAATISVRVDMGVPRLQRSQIPMASETGNGSNEQVVDEPLEVSGTTYRITGVSMGNPHVVIFVDDVESISLKEIGFEIEHHAIFPQRTNVHFVKVMGPHKLWMRTWERGAGDTLACGTGACAVVVAASLNGIVPAAQRSARVQLPGGDLDIEWAFNNHVYMTGPATTVYEAALASDFLNSFMQRRET